jgi:hypothetical protein
MLRYANQTVPGYIEKIVKNKKKSISCEKLDFNSIVQSTVGESLPANCCQNAKKCVDKIQS